jgi:glucosamine kinase
MIFLGIDGGATKTSCLIGDEKSVLGSGASGSSNLIRVGEPQARESLTTAIQQACAAALVSPAQIDKTCVGLAGAARPEISSAARRMMLEIVGGEVQIVGDTIIALEAAFGGGPGVVVIAGTGSIAYGHNAAGQTARAGGWGFAISDEGSGYWIGRAAVAAALRSLDEKGKSPLLDTILKTWKLESVDKLVVTANATPAPNFAALLPAVLAAANAGDSAANDVLAQAGSELAGCAIAVIRRLFPEASEIPVAMSGGIFQNAALVREHFYKGLHSEYPNASINETVVEPVRGALELARRSTVR